MIKHWRFLLEAKRSPVFSELNYNLNPKKLNLGYFSVLCVGECVVNRGIAFTVDGRKEAMRNWHAQVKSGEIQMKVLTYQMRRHATAFL